MTTALRVLIVEDCVDDAFLIERELHKADFTVASHRVETAEELQQALANQPWDVVIADYSMPHFDGMSALRLVKAFDEALPFILISGKICVETAVEVLKAGAHNYIMKDKIRLLGPAVGQALQDAACQRQAWALDRTNRTLARAVEQSPVSILITDTNGNIQHVNPKLCSLTGYSSEELIGKKPCIFKSGETSPTVYCELWNTLLDGREWRGVFRNRKKDGSLFWEKAVIAPVRDDGGQIIQFVGVKEDITERVEMEQQLKQTREEAECARQAKLRFLQIMSHELRTPLNAILGALQLSELDQAYDAEMTAYAKISLFSMLDTIDNILEASRIESAEKIFKQGPVQLEQLLATLGRLFSVAAQNKGLRLRMSLTGDLPRQIVTDGVHLQQVLVHLLNNAIKFTTAGTVDLSLGRESASLGNSAWLKIEVQDTGIGIKLEDQHVIFDLFSQADDTTTRRFGGSGLGLYLTKRLVELMGGTITLQSTPGVGSTFTVRLPLTTA